MQLQLADTGVGQHVPFLLLLPLLLLSFTAISSCSFPASPTPFFCLVVVPQRVWMRRSSQPRVMCGHLASRAGRFSGAKPGPVSVCVCVCLCACSSGQECWCMDRRKHPIAAQDCRLLTSPSLSLTHTHTLSVSVSCCCSYGAVPYGSIRNVDIQQRLRDGLELPRPATCPQSFFTSVLRKCWIREWRSRPSFADLKKSVIKSVAIPSCFPALS